MYVLWKFVYILQKVVYIICKKICTFFEGFGYQMYRPYTLSNLRRKIFIHQKIVYAKYIELFTLFENLCALSIQNYVHLLRICVY